MEASEAQGIVEKRELEKQAKNGNAPQVSPITTSSPETPTPAVTPEPIAQQVPETENPPMGPTNPEPIGTPNESNISQFPQPNISTPTEENPAA